MLASAADAVLFQGFHFTGARYLRCLQVAEGVIMKIGGWKTRAVFERYISWTSPNSSTPAVDWTRSGPPWTQRQGPKNALKRNWD